MHTGPTRATLASLLLAALSLSQQALAQDTALPNDAATTAPWTAVTPDQVVEQNARAAIQDDNLARLALIYLMHDEAEAGKARKALARIGASSATIAADARWLGLQLEPEGARVFSKQTAVRHSASADEAPRGLIREMVVMGPYQDNGGGLAKQEGPERAGQRFVNADDSWGAYRVLPQRSLVDMVDARGLPLDVYVHPRRESCSYLSTVVVLPAQPVQLHLASSGAYRLLLDGHTVAKDEAVLGSAMLDRLTLAIDAAAGEHLITVKVCSGARHDSGYTRLRFSDAQGGDLAVKANSDLSVLDRVKQRAAGAPRAKLKVLPTSLQRALRIAEQDSPQRILAAAIVRNGLRSDDLRSARAPGLLDRALKSGASADQLAVAGYLSSFGANRSSRLGQAIERAKQTRNAGALSFALRRLVLTRLNNGQHDLAYSMLQQPQLKKAQDTHARWLRLQVRSRLGSHGLQLNAAQDMAVLAKTLGPAAPLVVWQSLASSGRAVEPQISLRAHQMLASLAPGHRNSAYLRAQQLLGAPWLRYAGMRAALHQRDANELHSLARSLHQAGHYPAARELTRLTATISPNHAHVFQHLADLEVLIDGPAGKPAAISALKRASQLKPQDPIIKAALAFRQGELAAGPRAGEHAPYLVKPQVFLQRKKARPAPKTGVHARQLHWRRVVRFHPDKRVSQMIHYAREIIVEPRTEAERYESIPDGMYGELLLARVHKRDGSVVQPEEKDDSGGMVRWPKLQRGDVVEVAIVSFTPGPVGRRGDPPFYFVDYVGSTASEPVLYNEVVFDAPEGSQLTWDVLGGKADEVKTHKVGARTVTHLIWNNPPTVAEEPWSPRMSETLPLVVGSAYPNWDAFVSWYRGAVQGFTEPDDQIKRLAGELTAKAKSREQKLKAIFNFVADDIRYVNFRSGEWWLPNRPQELLARRQGDCDDKAMLLISLLKAVNINAKEVLVQTRLTSQRRVMSSRKTAIPMFDHGIIYLPNENGEGGRFLDATSPQSRVFALPAMDAGAMVLMVGDKDSRIIKIPESRAEEHGVTANWTLALKPDGSGSLNAVETHVGDRAFQLRSNLREADARAQWVEQNLIGGWLSAVSVDKQVRFDGEAESGLAQVEYRANSGSLARREGRDLIVTIAPPVALTATLAPLTRRTLPVELPHWLAPSHRNMTVTIAAPDGYGFAALPPDANLKGPFGSASLQLTVSKDGRRATLVRTMAFETSRIAVADYPAWRTFLQRFDRMSQRGVRLVPKD